MNKYREQVIEKMAHYLNTESRMGNFIFCEKLIRGMLFETAEVAIVERLKPEHLVAYDLDMQEKIKNGWVKEIKS